MRKCNFQNGAEGTFMKLRGTAIILRVSKLIMLKTWFVIVQKKKCDCEEQRQSN